MRTIIAIIAIILTTATSTAYTTNTNKGSFVPTTPRPNHTIGSATR